jgi:hypothetical protein
VRWDVAMNVTNSCPSEDEIQGCRSSIMAIDLMWYWPKDGADLVLKILEDGDNVCSRIAHQLHEIAVHQCQQSAKEPMVFSPNLVYEFGNGLVFRLFDDEDGNDNEVLEFLVPDYPEKQRKTTVLLEIPTLLRQAGFEDEGTLVWVREVIRTNMNLAKPDLTSPRESRNT